MRRLLIRPGAIGDCIVWLPALECLRAEYTEVWVPGRNVPLIQCVDRVCSIASTGIDLAGVIEPPPGLFDRLRGFDSIISWYGANRPEFRAAVADLPFEFHPALPDGMAEEHAADFYLRQIGFPPGGVPHIECEVPPGDFVAIHPFSGSPRKNWPLENFEELARRLERHAPVAWCVKPDGPPRIDDLYELACWLARARLYAGNDSGISHLAAAVGTPVVAWFGPSEPKVWAPRGASVAVIRNGGIEAMEEACVRLISHV